jgi:hypothetical protein
MGVKGLSWTGVRVTILGLGLAVAAGGTQATGVTALPAEPFTFETPRVVDPLYTYGEPDIGIAPNQLAYVSQPSDMTRGEVYVSGPTGTGTQRSRWEGSVDGGHTFRNIRRGAPQNAPIDPCNIQTGLPPVCGSVAGPGGGDTEINFDSGRKQYFADLYALACQHTATRTVDGTTHQETVNENDLNGGCPVPGSDRQWILVRATLMSNTDLPNPPASAALQSGSTWSRTPWPAAEPVLAAAPGIPAPTG